MWGDSRLAGRQAELRSLGAALERAASGTPCAVVVHGEAGVGKTRLLREVCNRSVPDASVLVGACVRFGEASVPFAPVTGALRGWWARADDATRVEVFAGVDELGALLPELGAGAGRGGGGPGRLLPLIDVVVGRLAARGLTVVMIDDLQWADRSSLDVLAYLIAGFREQRLALLMTCRDEHRGEGHPLHTWLADMRRLPLFGEVHLDRLDMADAESQIAQILRRDVDIVLAAQVYERSGGNPYLTELLVRGMSGTESKLPLSAPADLRDALMAAWHGLSATARQVTRVLAVSGRPTSVTALREAVGEDVLPVTVLSRCLVEARDHGVVLLNTSRQVWFRHPLLAEVLHSDLPPGEAAAIHATYAKVLETHAACGSPDLATELAADLAGHHHEAGNVDAAYRWSLAAADHAARLQAAAAEAIHLRRACALWSLVSPNHRGSTADRLALLRRASDACGRAGQAEANLTIAEQALSLIDRDVDPLLASSLLLARYGAKYARGDLKREVTDELVEAVELTKAFPDSPERAQALTRLAFAQKWDGQHAAATTYVEQAVQVARRSGSELALASSLSVRASIRLTYDASAALADAQLAARLARSHCSAIALQDAAIWQVNCLVDLGRTDEAIEVALETFNEVVGKTSHWAYFLAYEAADALLWRGRWDECNALLRTALAARCEGIPGASIRLTAAQLAARRGRTAEAVMHLERAMELISEDYAGLRWPLTVTKAEVLLASGEPTKALRWLHSRIVVPDSSAASSFEDVLADATHAAAAAVQAARDAGNAIDAAQVIALLDDLIGRWPEEPFTAPRPDSADRDMVKALFEADLARCRDAANQAELWWLAIDTCRIAEAPWHEAMSRLRCAEAMLADRAPASTVSVLLRTAHETAVRLNAEPLRTDIETLARVARITLQPPVPIRTSSEASTLLAGLTKREREVLTYLAAGRSNGEIARALFISDKTVSVHVSNILRKTRTPTRIAAAALIKRLEQAIPHHHGSQHSRSGNGPGAT